MLFLGFSSRCRYRSFGSMYHLLYSMSFRGLLLVRSTRRDRLRFLDSGPLTVPVGMIGLDLRPICLRMLAFNSGVRASIQEV